MTTLSILVRVSIWILGLYKLEALGVLMGSLEICSLDCGKVFVLLLILFFIFYFLFDVIVELPTMDEN
jgi:hypothetical protein